MHRGAALHCRGAPLGDTSILVAKTGMWRLRYPCRWAEAGGGTLFDEGPIAGRPFSVCSARLAAGSDTKSDFPPTRISARRAARFRFCGRVPEESPLELLEEEKWSESQASAVCSSSTQTRRGFSRDEKHLGYEERSGIRRSLGSVPLAR